MTTLCTEPVDNLVHLLRASPEAAMTLQRSSHADQKLGSALKWTAKTDCVHADAEPIMGRRSASGGGSNHPPRYTANRERLICLRGQLRAQHHGGGDSARGRAESIRRS